MSNADVGDAVEIAFHTAPGATVNTSWMSPDGTTVLDHVTVAEDPITPGRFPYTFVLTAPGLWEALFTASGTTTEVERFNVRAVPVTGPPPLATLGEVAAQFGTMTAAQQSLANTLLRAASKLIRQRYPSVDANIASGRLDAEVVALAVINMVLRVLRNPRGLKAETTGPFSVTYDTTIAAGQLVLSETETSLLVPGGNKAGGRARTIWTKPGLLPGRSRGW